MKYLISLFSCNIYDGNNFECLPNVKYLINDMNGFYLNCEFVSYVELNKLQQVNVGNNTYYFLINKPKVLSETIDVKSKLNYRINVGNILNVCVDGDKIFEENNVNLSYSHFEEIEGKTIIYFEGNRNFVVILNGCEVLFANYYDEVNVLDNERVFMCKLFDSVNHGKVCSVGKTVETYLVYLDDFEMKLKEEFLTNVFVDCLSAGNYNYCNSLLDESLKQSEAKSIGSFFNGCEKFVMIEENTFVGLEKNAVKGIFKFEVENFKIVNILEL